MEWFNEGNTGHFLCFETKWLGQDREHWLQMQHHSHISFFLALYTTPTNGLSSTGTGGIWRGTTGGEIGKGRIKGTPPPTAGLWGILLCLGLSNILPWHTLSLSTFLCLCGVLVGESLGINDSRVIKAESKRSILHQDQKDNYRIYSYLAKKERKIHILKQLTYQQNLVKFYHQKWSEVI